MVTLRSLCLPIHCSDFISEAILLSEVLQIKGKAIGRYTLTIECCALANIVKYTELQFKNFQCVNSEMQKELLILKFHPIRGGHSCFTTAPSYVHQGDNLKAFNAPYL